MKKFILLSLALAFCFTAHAQGKAKSFTLKGLSGGSVSLSSYLGKKAIVLNFWAAWCDTCEEEIPELNRLQSSGGAVFIGVNAGDSAEVAKKFVDRTGYPYQVALDSNKSVSRSFGVAGVPQTIIISKSGEIVYTGSRPPSSMPSEAK